MTSRLLLILAPVLVALAILAASPAPAQTYRVNEALGELLSKQNNLSLPSNPGGKNILEHSCIYKNDFSLSASEKLLETCDVPKAVGEFTAKYGRPDQTAKAQDGRTILEYFLEYKQNQYRVKFYIGCADNATDAFSMVECTLEKNRVPVGGPPKKRPFLDFLRPDR